MAKQLSIRIFPVSIAEDLVTLQEFISSVDIEHLVDVDGQILVVYSEA